MNNHEYRYRVASEGKDGRWYPGGGYQDDNLQTVIADADICQQDYPHSVYGVKDMETGEIVYNAHEAASK